MQINDNNRKCFGHIFKITDDDDVGLKAVFVEAFQSLPDCFGGFFLFIFCQTPPKSFLSSFTLSG